MAVRYLRAWSPLRSARARRIRLCGTVRCFQAIPKLKCQPRSMLSSYHQSVFLRSHPKAQSLTSSCSLSFSSYVSIVLHWFRLRLSFCYLSTLELLRNSISRRAVCFNMAEVESVPVSEPCAGIGLDIATIKESKRLNSKVDGSQLSWRNFRRDVLAPHRIRILESATKRLPERLVTMFDAQNKNTSKYETQMSDFRDQVAKGRGFGPSPLFPPNLLPPIEGFHHVARCMVPAFSREAQPDRALNQLGPLYELNPPRPGLGVGFPPLLLSGMRS